MMIIVGTRCKDGVVIGADSSVTFGASPTQREQPTDRRIEIVGGEVIVAGTGFVGQQQLIERRPTGGAAPRDKEQRAELATNPHGFSRSRGKLQRTVLLLSSPFLLLLPLWLRGCFVGRRHGERANECKNTQQQQGFAARHHGSTIATHHDEVHQHKYRYAPSAALAAMLLRQAALP
jgi:hypothetical protein